MKFTINSKELLSRLQIANKAVNSKSPIQILTNFLFTANGENLSVIGSNAEICVNVAIPAIEFTDGVPFCVDAQKLTNIIKSLADMPITIERNSNDLHITYPNGKHKIGIIPNPEYPVMQREEGADKLETIVLTAKTLTGAISKTAFAASNDALHPNMHGIFLDFKEGEMTAVATDTHVMSKYVSKCEDVAGSYNFILPRWSFPVLLAAASLTEKVVMMVDDRMITIAGEGFIITTTKIKGNYPAYERVFPKAISATAAINRMDILAAINRAMTCSDDDVAVLRCDFENESLKISSSAPVHSLKAESTIPCEYNGAPITIGFNGKYLHSMLAVIASSEVIVGLNSPSTPATFSAAKGEGEEADHTLLVMPVTLVLN